MLGSNPTPAPFPSRALDSSNTQSRAKSWQSTPIVLRRQKPGVVVAILLSARSVNSGAHFVFDESRASRMSVAPAFVYHYCVTRVKNPPASVRTALAKVPVRSANECGVEGRPTLSTHEREICFARARRNQSALPSRPRRSSLRPVSNSLEFN